jgi:hypothetical protein
MHQHAEIAEFLPHLVRGGCQPGGHTDRGIGSERAGDRQSAEKIVQRIAEQSQIRHRPRRVGRDVMAMVPVQELFESEECDEPGDDPASRVCGFPDAR